MRILICTQIVDQEDTVLGFFHRWLIEFAANVEQVHVLCLKEGSHNLPENVAVHSLGKEEGVGRFTYLKRFFAKIYQLRHDYDVVFVHMNPEYVILGGVWWRLWGKRIGFWYTHKSVNFRLRIAALLTHIIFTATAESFRLSSPKVSITGHGIDTDFYKSDPGSQKEFDLITIGRISRSKNLHAQLAILEGLRQHHDISLTIVGPTITADDGLYQAELIAQADDLGITNALHFALATNPEGVVSYLRRAKVFVHTSETGSLDKAVLEAIAAGLPVVSSSEGSVSLPLGSWLVSGEQSFTKEITAILEGDSLGQLATLQEYVREQHSLSVLIPHMLSLYETRTTG